MKLSLQIPDEINDIITALTESFSITSIVESSGVSTITTETLTIFDNLSETMLLKSGMVVTIGDVNYQVSNIVNSLVNTFDVTATNLTDTEWNVAASFKFGSQNEIDKALNQENNNDSKLKRFPLIWLFTPIERDFNNQVIDFESDLVFSFAFQSNKTDRFQKRLDGNIKTILEPLLKLFLLHVQSSDFNYMFEFEGYQKALDIQTNNFYFYGTSDQSKSVLNTTTDAIEVQTSLKFKKQFEYITPLVPPTTPIPFESDALFWLDGTISGNEFIDVSGNNKNFTITNKDFSIDGLPYKSAATISAPIGDSTLIAADINNFLYDSGGTPNQIPVVSFFQNIDYENKLFCRHEVQVLDGNGVETYEPRVLDIVLYDTVKERYDLLECQDYYSVPNEELINVKWVSPNGNDTTGDGTKGLPYLTFAKAIGTVFNNGTIYLTTGEINEICAITNKGVTVKGIGLVKHVNTSYSYQFTTNITDPITVDGQILGNVGFSFRSYGCSADVIINKCKINTQTYTSASNPADLYINESIINAVIFYNARSYFNTNHIVPDTSIVPLRINNDIISINNYYSYENSNKPFIQRGANTALISMLGDVCVGNPILDESISAITDININYCELDASSSGIVIALVNAVIAINLTISNSLITNKSLGVSTAIEFNGHDFEITNNTFINNYRVFGGVANSSGKNGIFSGNRITSDYDVSISSKDYVVEVFDNILVSETSSRIDISSVNYAIIATIHDNYLVSKNTNSPFIYIGDEYTTAISDRLNGSKIYNNRLSGPEDYGNDRGSMHGVFIWSQAIECYNNFISGTNLGFVAKSNGGTYNNIFHHNIVHNTSMSYTIKGIKGTLIYNNISNNASFYNGLAEVFPGSEGDSGNTTLKNNIVVGIAEFLIIENTDQLIGCTFDTNLYYNSISDNIAQIGVTKYNLTGWQVLGYDLNSIFQNPNLVDDLWPLEPIQIGEDLGVDYEDGLDISTNWGDENTLPVIVTRKQSTLWDIGAYIS